ncbi:MAG: hypothetical protein K0U36_02575 [Alphaproteobacteria bacterium]|nr:hypothetical protein [Alphaproteobacteria bacterium]
MNSQTALVLKLSAFGDIIFALPAILAIHAHHARRGEKLVAITTPPYVAFFRALHLFDDVIVHRRFKWYQPDRLMALRGEMMAYAPALVYDLQSSGRTKWYARAMRALRWNSVHPGSDFRFALSYLGRRQLSPVLRDLQQVAVSGVPASEQQSPVATLRGLFGRESLSPDHHPASQGAELATSHGGLREHRRVIVVPFASSPKKRWPIENYCQLVESLLSEGDSVTVLGGKDDVFPGDRFAHQPRLTNLVGKVAWDALPLVVMQGTHFVGNDTGATHLCWMLGLRGVVLFGAHDWPGLEQFPSWARAVALSQQLIDGHSLDAVRDALTEA